MKRIFCTVGIMLALAAGLFAQNTAIYKSQGGAAMVVGSGGTLTVASGGALTLASGSTISNAATLTQTGAAYFGAANKVSSFPVTGSPSLYGNLTVSGSITAGSGAVGIVDGTGKIPALSSTYIANLSGANLTALTAANVSAGTLGATVIASSVGLSGFYSDDLVRSKLGLAIGSNVQAYDADLGDLADGSLTGSKVGDGVPAANIAAGTLDTDVIASSVGLSGFYSDDLVRARLGLAIGTNVQAYDADLDDLADGSLSGAKVGSGVPAANIANGSLGAEVICSSMSVSAIASLTTVSADNVTAGTMAADVIASSAAVNIVESLNILDGEIVDADINASAAIADSKLAQITTDNKVAAAAIAAGTIAADVIASSVAINIVESLNILDGAIVDADINASAAISKSKLGALAIVNADVDAAAAIVDTKLATISTAGKVNAAALTGAMPIGVQPFQSSDCEALTPSAEGQFCYDTTAHKLNVSTSTANGGFEALH